MANRECKGDVFSVHGSRFYRCFWDGALVVPAPENGRACPHCQRIIDATDNGDLTAETVYVVTLKAGWQVTVPAPNVAIEPRR